MTGITVKSTKNEKYTWAARLEKHRDETFIKAKSSKQVRLYLKRDTEIDKVHIKGGREYYFDWKQCKLSPMGFVEIEIIPFKGNKKKKIVNLDRTSLEAFLNNSIKN